jgi:hypothetical protein
MNLRIDKLIDDARLTAVAEMFEVELTKFAELIVAECIQTIQMGITRDGHNTEKYQRSIKHIKQIKEHFGVEE